MLGMKTHFDISGSIEIREVDIAGVACIWKNLIILLLMAQFCNTPTNFANKASRETGIMPHML